MKLASRDSVEWAGEVTVVIKVQRIVDLKVRLIHGLAHRLEYRIVHSILRRFATNLFDDFLNLETAIETTDPDTQVLNELSQLF